MRNLIISILLVFLIILVIVLISPPKSTQKTLVEDENIELNTETKVTVNEPIPSEVLPELKQWNFEVSSTIVKKISNDTSWMAQNYRYFFTVKNLENEDFSGSLNIILNSESNDNTYPDFTGEILAEGAFSEYIDAVIAPYSQDKKRGAKIMTFILKDEKEKEIFKRTINVTEKYEEVSSF